MINFDQLLWRLKTLKRQDGRWFVYHFENRYFDTVNQKMVNNELLLDPLLLAAAKYAIIEMHCIKSSKSLFRTLFDNQPNNGPALTTKDEPRFLIDRALSNFYLPGLNFHEYIRNLNSDISMVMAFETTDENYQRNHSFEYKNMVALSLSDRKEAAMFKLQFC